MKNYEHVKVIVKSKQQLIFNHLRTNWIIRQDNISFFSGRIMTDLVFRSTEITTAGKPRYCPEMISTTSFSLISWVIVYPKENQRKRGHSTPVRHGICA